MNRQATDTEARILDEDYRASFERQTASAQHLKQPGRDGCRCLVPGPEQNDARSDATGGSQEVSKIEVARHDDPALLNSLGQDPVVSQALKGLLTKVYHVHARLAQGVDRCHRNAHVSQQFHAAGFANG